MHMTQIGNYDVRSFPTIWKASASDSIADHTALQG